MSFELERIEELCQERGWSHYRLAIEMDTSPNNIGNLFRRTTVPSIPTIRRICEVMGITIAQFYSTDGVQVTLNEQQARILDLYDKLDQTDKARAESYKEGLSARDQTPLIPDIPYRRQHAYPFICMDKRRFWSGS